MYEMDDDFKKKIADEIEKIDAYSKAILDRVKSMRLIHESLLVIEKIDVRSVKSFLFFVENSKLERLKSSYYGRVLRISEIDSNDEVVEAKKKILQIGDVVSFNPDVGYSLNVIVPEEMPEIWVISVDNVLVVDSGFDPIEAKKKTIEANALIERRNGEIQREVMRKEHQALADRAKREGKLI